MRRLLAWNLTGIVVTALVAVLFCSARADIRPRYLVLGDSIGVGIGQAMKASGLDVDVCARSGQRHEKVPDQLLKCAKGYYEYVLVSTGTNEASHSVSAIYGSAILYWLRAHSSTRKAVPIIVGPPCTRKSWDHFSASIDRHFKATLSAVNYRSLRAFCADASDGVHHSTRQYRQMWDHIRNTR